MCRLLAYLGPPATLDPLVNRGRNSLYEQSYRPREMLSGTVNVDGFGAAWYVPPAREPVRFASVQPMWQDTSFKSLGRVYASACVLAVVRGATEGMPFGEENVPPLSHGALAFGHNGSVKNFRRTLLRPMLDALDDAVLATMSGQTDSAHLFALLRQHLGAAHGATALADALATTTREVLALSEAHRTESQLAMIVTDGTCHVAARAASKQAPSLYVFEQGDVRIIASEPLDEDRAWHVVPTGSIVVATPAGIEVGAL